MYVFFNSNKEVAEYISDNLTAGSSSSNEIYAYWDSTTFTSGAVSLVSIKFKKIGGEELTIEYEGSLEDNVQVPPSDDKDYKYFKEYTNYKMAKFSIPDEVLSQEGAWIATIRMSNSDGSIVYAMDDITFMVKGSYAYDSSITESQYNYLLYRYDNKQDKLTAGDNITIDENNVISSKDTTYTAGDNITIDSNNKISAFDGIITYYQDDANVKVNDNFEVAYDTVLDGKLSVSGESTFNGDITVKDESKVSGDIVFSDSIDFEGKTDFLDAVDFAKSADFEENVEFNKNITVYGDITLNGSLKDDDGNDVLASKQDALYWHHINFGSRTRGEGRVSFTFLCKKPTEFESLSEFLEYFKPSEPYTGSVEISIWGNGYVTNMALTLNEAADSLQMSFDEEGELENGYISVDVWTDDGDSGDRDIYPDEFYASIKEIK